jgi:hypothetical protein
MEMGHLVNCIAGLALALPLLTACHRPGDPPVDTSLQDSSDAQKRMRQQEIERQLEQQQRAADMQRAQQMAPPNMSAH